MGDFLKFIKYKDKHKIKSIVITMLGALIYSIGLQWFIFPANQYPGGFPGVAKLIAEFLEASFGIKIGINILWFALNIPVFYLGFKGVGKRFTILSLVSVAFGSLALQFLPPLENIIGETALSFKNDYMLSAIVGGVIAGIGVGITLKVGSSTGGMDIVSQYLSIKKNGSIGQFSFIINFFIILIVGITNEWYFAAYTIINLFISSVVIDKIHTRHNKLTLMIITDKREEVVSALHKRVYRGITILPAQGAYSRQEKSVLLMVISSFELYNVISTINEIDAVAFTNVMKSQNVFGNFVKAKID